MANELMNTDPFADDPFENIFKGFFQPVRRDRSAALPSIKVDVKESAKAYTVRADVPGMKKEDIQVDVNGDMVTIRAENKSEKETREGEKVVYRERSYGSLYRSFNLGQDVDASQAQARYENGVLELTLPKKANASARRLPVA